MVCFQGTVVGLEQEVTRGLWSVVRTCVPQIPSKRPDRASGRGVVDRHIVSGSQVCVDGHFQRRKTGPFCACAMKASTL